MAPPNASVESHLEPSHWDGNPVEFNVDVNYTCERGMKFEDDFDQGSLAVRCLEDNVWSTPTVWPVCVESKAYLW